MATLNIKQADKKGRVTIPDLANATIIVERISPSEFRIKKAQVIPECDLAFPEESFPIELSTRDAVSLLGLLDKPPAANKAAKDAAKEFMKNYGNTMGHRKTKQ